MTNCFKVFIAKHLENSAATGSHYGVYTKGLCPASLNATETGKGCTSYLG